MLIFFSVSGSNMNSQKSNPLATLQYGPIVNNAAPSMPPSQMFVQYDPGQPVNNQPSAGPPGAPPQNLNSSQIIGSHLIQQQRPVQNVQAVQPQSSFYSQPQQPLQQTGFYQAQQAASSITVSTLSIVFSLLQPLPKCFVTLSSKWKLI